MITAYGTIGSIKAFEDARPMTTKSGCSSSRYSFFVSFSTTLLILAIRQFRGEGAKNVYFARMMATIPLDHS